MPNKWQTLLSTICVILRTAFLQKGGDVMLATFCSLTIKFSGRINLPILEFEDLKTFVCDSGHTQMSGQSDRDHGSLVKAKRSDRLALLCIEVQLHRTF